jgi:hypothetical protein
LDCTLPSRDLTVAAHEAGNSIICNGSQKSQQDKNCNHVFRCGTFHRTMQTSAMELTDDCQHIITSLINDRRKNRQHGQILAKRINVVDQLNGILILASILTCVNGLAVPIMVLTQNYSTQHLFHYPPDYLPQTKWTRLCTW